MAKRTTREYVSIARKNGVDVEYCAKHIKMRGTTVEGKRSTMMIPHDLRGNGTERVIVKWFRTLGILLTLFLLALWIL
jgi:hypothetical protein